MPFHTACTVARLPRYIVLPMGTSFAQSVPSNPVQISINDQGQAGNLSLPLQVLLLFTLLSSIPAFLLYVPFLILDLVVSSILLSMGMFMPSPVLISLPFKLISFVLVDGWHPIVGSLVKSFQ